MAERRMFSMRIINSARFLRMPISTQALYFHLGLNADDDGIVEAFPVMQMVGCTEDDLKVLVAKNFVQVLNEDLVSYIIDWRENNRIRPDRKIDSIYHDLLLSINPDVELVESRPRADAYSGNKAGRPMDNQWTTSGRPADDQWTTNGQSMDGIGKDRLGKDRLGKDRLGNCIGDTSASTPQSSPKPPRSKFTKPSLKEVAEYCRERQNDVDPQRFIDYYESNGWKVGRNPMKDWKATVRSWESRQGQNKSSRQSASRRYEEPAPDHYESTFDAQAWEDYVNNFDPQDLLDEQEEMLKGG